jgi:hypothetical protein
MTVSTGHSACAIEQPIKLTQQTLAKVRDALKPIPTSGLTGAIMPHIFLAIASNWYGQVKSPAPWPDAI